MCIGFVGTDAVTGLLIVLFAGVLVGEELGLLKPVA